MSNSRMCEVAERLAKDGEARGEEKVSKLVRILIKEGKIEEIEKACKDREYRKKLYIQYGIE